MRKWFQQLRDVYVAAVSEIERIDNINVVWRKAFSKPQVGYTVVNTGTGPKHWEISSFTFFNIKVISMSETNFSLLWS